MGTIGQRIRCRREELDMSQDELAKRTGYRHRSSINKIETGRELPMRKVEVFAKALDTSVSYLMGWEDIVVNADDSANMIIDVYSNLNEEGKERLLEYAKLLNDSQSYSKKSDTDEVVAE